LNMKESVAGDVRDGINKAYEILNKISMEFDLPNIPRHVYVRAHELSKLVVKEMWEEIKKYKIDVRKQYGMALLLLAIDEDPDLPPSELWLNMMSKEMNERDKKVNIDILIDLKKKIKSKLKENIKNIEDVEVEKSLAVFKYLLRKFDYISEDFRISYATEVFEKIYRMAKKYGLTDGRSILSFSGATSYIVFNILNTDVNRRITQEEIANALGRGVNSIRSAHKLLLEKLTIIVIPPQKIQKRKKRARARKGRF